MWNSVPSRPKVWVLWINCVNLSSLLVVRVPKGRHALLLPTPLIDVQKKKKKQVTANEPDLVGDSFTIRYPSSAHAYSEFSPHVEESKKLMWVEDMATFKELAWSCYYYWAGDYCQRLQVPAYRVCFT